MGITLATLVSRLQADVPAVDSVPSSDQYTRAIKDAVADFSRRCGTEKIDSLSIVSGTAAYTLPDDFLKMIMLESFATADGVLITGEGIIPLSTTWEERHYIRGLTITFNPTPSYTMTREYRYKAAWALNDDGDEYEDMGEEEAGIILLRAATACLTKQSNVMAPEAFSYQQGDVSVNTGTQTLAVRAQLDSVEKSYLEACEKYNGQYGVLV
ncbi:MAG TPA: hypothetical protein VMW24_09115 [Sedimentisphaerales bacterium]|nr:hypothetical protein [Sedimentisphaerales bacterium]